jgi:hypothetical protein
MNSQTPTPGCGKITDRVMLKYRKHKKIRREEQDAGNTHFDYCS